MFGLQCAVQTKFSHQSRLSWHRQVWHEGDDMKGQGKVASTENSFHCRVVLLHDRKISAHLEVRPPATKFSAHQGSPSRTEKFSAHKDVRPPEWKFFSVHWRARLLPSRDFGNSANRQVGRSANRQFGKSADRQVGSDFGNSAIR